MTLRWKKIYFNSAVVECSARSAVGVQRRRAASDVARGGRGGPGRSWESHQNNQTPTSLVFSFFPGQGRGALNRIACCLSMGGGGNFFEKNVGGISRILSNFYWRRSILPASRPTAGAWSPDWKTRRRACGCSSNRTQLSYRGRERCRRALLSQTKLFLYYTNTACCCINIKIYWPHDFTYINLIQYI